MHSTLHHREVDPQCHGAEKDISHHLTQAHTTPVAFEGSCHNGRLHCMIRAQLGGAEATEKEKPTYPRDREMNMKSYRSPAAASQGHDYVGGSKGWYSLANNILVTARFPAAQSCPGEHAVIEPVLSEASSHCVTSIELPAHRDHDIGAQPWLQASAMTAHSGFWLIATKERGYVTYRENHC
jgi:hypothetical protein